MNYPGNQGQSGGWPSEQSPQPPYSPGQGRSSAPSHGERPFNPPADDEGPFAPRQDDSYGSSDPYRERGGYPPGGYEQGGYGQGGRHDRPTETHGTETHETQAYGTQAYGTETYGTPGQQEEAHGQAGAGRRGPTPPGRRSNLPLIAGGAVVAGLVLIGGGIGISGLLKDDAAPKSAKSPAAQQSQAGTATPTASPTRRIGGLGNSRTTDARPLTLNEIFRHRRFTVSKKRYAMTVRRADRNCGRTVNGTKLVTALRRGSCNQVLRATFTAGDGKLIGTIGVANLRTATAAKAATRVWNAKDAWVRPVPGAGITKKVGTGSALGTFQYKGHYLLMTWVQQPNGKEMPAGQHALISKFGQDVMLGSGLFEALNYRGNTGKPLQK